MAESDETTPPPARDPETAAGTASAAGSEETCPPPASSGLGSEGAASGTVDTLAGGVAASETREGSSARAATFEGPAPSGASPARPVGSPAGGKASDEGLAPGTQVGSFEIVRELGRGGMGQVYLAHDQRLQREVALKVLSPGRAGPDALKRFEVEAQTAARLRHAGIVAVHEVGEVEGRPFIAMDFVEGESLSQRIRREPLPQREAAELIEKLAWALAYAHERAVLHRDLKPGNVLLDGDQPLITDFGLAKDVAAGTDELTRSGQVLGTPAYMPPEQAEGRLDLIDRRSDVYSLGATLFAALTGRPPFTGNGVMNVLNAVLHSDPPRPRDLRAGLDPSLETICLKCLAKEPAERYASAQELAEDLGRFLRHEPILARPPSLLERAAKWQRRNRALTWGVGVTSALALLALGAGLYVRSQEVEASNRTLQSANADLEAERLALEAANQKLIAQGAALRDKTDEAEARAREVQRQADALREEKARTEGQRTLAIKREQVARDALKEITSEMFGHMHEHADPVSRRRQSEFLTKAIERYEELLELDTEHGIALNFDRAEAIRIAAEQALNAGQLAPARRLLERAVTALRAVATSEGDLAPVVSGSQILESYTPALIRLAEVQRRQNDVDASIKTSAEAVAFAERMVERLAGHADPLRWLAQSLDRLAEGHEAKHDSKQARVHFLKALAVARELAKREPEEASSLQVLQHALYHMGDLHREAGEFAQSEAAFRESLALLRELARDGHSRVTLQLGTQLLRGLGGTLAALKKHAAAQEAYREGAELARELVALDPGSATNQAELSLFLFQTAEANVEGEESHEKALLAYQEAIAIRRQLLAIDPSDAFSRDVLYRALDRVSEIYELAERPRPALSAALEALTLLRAEHKEGKREDLGPRWARTLSRVGSLRRSLGDLNGAYQAYLEAVQKQRGLSIHAPKDVSLQETLIQLLNDYAQVQFERFELEDAQVAAAEQVQRTRALLSASPKDTGRRRNVTVALGMLAKIHWRAGHSEATLRTYEEAEANHRQLAKQDPRFKGELEQIVSMTELHRTQVGLLLGKRKPTSSGDHLHLAYAYLDRRDYAKSIEHFKGPLEDPEVWQDLQRSDLYRGSCVAALGAIATEDPQVKQAYQAQALAWLKRDVDFRRSMIAEVTSALRSPQLPPQRREQGKQFIAHLKEHLAYVASEDPDFRELRPTPAFKKLFARKQD